MGAKKAPEDKLRVAEPEWPAADRQAWNVARQKGDIFGETGRAANWSATSEGTPLAPTIVVSSAAVATPPTLMATTAVNVPRPGGYWQLSGQVDPPALGR